MACGVAALNIISGPFMLMYPWLMFPYNLFHCIAPNHIKADFKTNTTFEITPIWYGNKFRNIGIEVNTTIVPTRLYLSCRKKGCLVTDIFGNTVNQITIKQQATVNKKKLSNARNQELKAIQKAKEEAEKERKRTERQERRRIQQQEESCPDLYALRYSFQGDIILQTRYTRTWLEKGCNEWLQRELYK